MIKRFYRQTHWFYCADIFNFTREQSNFFQKLPQRLILQAMFFKQPQQSPNIWATFLRKFVAHNFLKSPNLVTLKRGYLFDLPMHLNKNPSLAFCSVCSPSYLVFVACFFSGEYRKRDRGGGSFFDKRERGKYQVEGELQTEHIAKGGKSKILKFEKKRKNEKMTEACIRRRRRRHRCKVV